MFWKVLFTVFFIQVLSFNNEIDKIFEHYPGCQVLVNRNGQTIFQKGYGLRNIEEDLPNNDKDLPFQIASISKQFTGLAIALLAEEGKLSEDDSIKKYFQHLDMKLKFATYFIILLVINHMIWLEFCQIKILIIGLNQKL